jgi:hypothetical protein
VESLFAAVKLAPTFWAGTDGEDWAVIERIEERREAERGIMVCAVGGDWDEEDVKDGCAVVRCKGSWPKSGNPAVGGGGASDLASPARCYEVPHLTLVSEWFRLSVCWFLKSCVTMDESRLII